MTIEPKPVIPLYVLIATANRAKRLEDTLKSLAACRRPDNLEQVLVVENGPRYGVEQVLVNLSAALPLRYLYHPVANKSSALNAALEYLSEGLVVFLDDDVDCDPDLLAAYARAAARHGSGSYFGGRFNAIYESAPPAAWLRPFLPPSVTGFDRDDEAGPPPYFFGCNWAAYVTDLKHAGGFDARFGPGSVPSATGQETDMHLRLDALGLRAVYVSDAKVSHSVPPENTTAPFALHRRRRSGVHCGLSGRGDCHGVAQALRRAAHHAVRWLAKSLLGYSKAARFRHRCELNFAIGVLMGNWHRFGAGRGIRRKCIV